MDLNKISKSLEELEDLFKARLKKKGLKYRKVRPDKKEEKMEEDYDVKDNRDEYEEELSEEGDESGDGNY